MSFIEPPPVFPNDSQDEVIILEPPNMRYVADNLLRDNQHVLTSKHNQDIILESTKEYDVGTADDSDIKFSKGMNISRDHAYFTVNEKVELTNIGGTGTYVLRDQEWIKLNNEDFVLKHGDMIGFGMKKVFFRYEYRPNTFIRR